MLCIVYYLFSLEIRIKETAKMCLFTACSGRGMSPGICLHVKIPPKLQILFYEQLPAQDLDFHIFSNNMIIANKWLISPQSLKIFIFVCFLTTLHVQLANRNEDVARDVLWEPGRGNNFDR